MTTSPKFTALTPATLTRVMTMADWAWQGRGRPARGGALGPSLPASAGTAEAEALKAYLSNMPLPALAELLALAWVGAGVQPAENQQRSFGYALTTARSAISSTPVALEKLGACGPLGDNIRRGLARLQEGALIRRAYLN